MSEIVETITVEGSDGQPLRINRSDYDASPDLYVVIDAPEPVAPVKSVAAPTQVLVSKEGTGAKARFYLTNEAGERIEDKGYDTEALAWGAAMALAPAP